MSEDMLNMNPCNIYDTCYGATSSNDFKLTNLDCVTFSDYDVKT